MWKRSVLIISCVLMALAFLSTSQAQIGEKGSSETRPGKDQEAVDLVELGKMHVEGQRLEPMNELSLRLVKWAMEVDRTSRHDEKWKPRCWLDKAIGSHIQYLYCATNGELNAITAQSRGVFAEYAGMGAGGGSGNEPIPQLTNVKVVRSQFPVSRGELNQVLENLGPVHMNKEAVMKVLEGKRAPENLPLEHELDKFSKALSKVRGIRADLADRLERTRKADRERLVAESDERMAAAIQEEGLTINRYNEISEQVSEYVSLKAEVRERLARN